MKFRVERPGDAGPVWAVLTAAFETDAEARLVDALRDTDAWLPGLSMVAEENGRILAYALLSRVTVGPDPALALGPVAVLPAEQRRGLGAAVISEVLRLATAAGERLVLVLGDPAYYRRFGFVPAAPYRITSPWSDLGDAWQVLVLTPAEARYPGPWHQL
ncbi:GNAT family N-acetyltransferase [Couchioplanes azureus]|uniref:GNAT family N-acetyltransferase n=1 Tax=Couchioplanes caeruleus TaxID=56438 RepID=UPI00166FBA6A|nr:N-acetyltransferase [Couchioplanes caeruleus]GGQ45385.1 N-acetyltransferase [Couchioplanes caeruleus subsp. azureus]